ncbi:MAG: carboxypeptidase regulatory-like domain-containing protein, partial [Nanoarchaeota archaeon]
MTRHNTAFWIMVSGVVCLALFGVLIFHDLTGFVGYQMNVTSGYIYKVNIHHQQSPAEWVAFYGNALLVPSSTQNSWNATVAPGTVEQEDFNFNCFGKTGYDFYASIYKPSELDITSLTNASIEDIDDFIDKSVSNLTMTSTNASTVFNDSMQINVGGERITSVAAFTKQRFGGKDFGVMALKDSTGKLLFGVNSNTSAQGFNGQIFTYQMILPLPYNATSITYHFYPDPISDPLGNCSQFDFALIKGYVTRIDTQDYLSNVSINISGQVITTDVNGYYSALLEVGEHIMVAQKAGYLDYFAQIAIEQGVVTWHNFSMIPDPGGMPLNATIVGHTYDNATHLPLGNVTIAASGGSTTSWGNTTNDTGFFLLAVGAGNISYYAMRTGYHAILGNISIAAYETQTVDIYLSPVFAGEGTTNAWVQGFVFDNSTGFPLPNATVAAGTQSGYTDDVGYYLFPTVSGNNTLVITKLGFNTHTENFTIRAYETVEKNASLNPILGQGNQNAILSGWVTDTYFAWPIENVTVSAGDGSGGTNGSGYYTFPVYSGNITVTATKVGYNPYVALTELNPWENKIHNFTMHRGIDDYPNATLVGTTFDGIIPVPNVTISLAGFVFHSNENGTFNISFPARTYYDIFAIKDEYNIFHGNLSDNTSVSPGNTTYYNISLELYTPPGLGPGAGPGAGPGGGSGLGPGLGVGKGPGTGATTVTENPSPSTQVPSVQQKAVGFSDIMLSLDRIVRKIRKGSFLEDFILLYNYRDTETRVQMSIEGEVKDIIELKTPDVTIAPNRSVSLRFRILGKAPEGIYNGNMIFSGDYNAVIPVEITIITEEDVPIESLILNIKPLKKIILTNELFRYKVDLINLLTDRSYDMDLHYTIRSTNGTEITSIGDSSLKLQTFNSLIEEYRVPNNFTEGDYIITVDALYLNRTATASSLFSVRIPAYKYKLFGFMPVWMLSLLLMLFAGSYFAIIVIRHEQEKKKRFHAKIDFKLLPGPGDRSLFVGQLAETTRDTFLDMDVLTVHTIVA